MSSPDKNNNNLSDAESSSSDESIPLREPARRFKKHSINSSSSSSSSGGSSSSSSKSHETSETDGNSFSSSKSHDTLKTPPPKTITVPPSSTMPSGSKKKAARPSGNVSSAGRVVYRAKPTTKKPRRANADGTPASLKLHSHVNSAAEIRPGVPGLSNFKNFSTAINPNTGQSFFYGAMNCVNIIRDIFNVRIPEYILDSKIIKTPLRNYQKFVWEGTVATALTCCVYGFDVSFDGPNKSYNSRLHACRCLQKDGNADPLEFFVNHFKPLVDYVFQYVIPAFAEVKLANFKTQSVPQFTKSLLRPKSRCAWPLWSIKHTKTLKLTPHDSNFCDGHLYEYALVLDRIIPGMAKKSSEKGWRMDDASLDGERDATTM